MIDPAVAIVSGFVLIYLASCWRNPYSPRKCWWCGGKTRRTGWFFRAYRDRSSCWWCGGNTKRRRIGARLLGRG